MAESNATQVILTDDGLKIINAQNTADSAASQAGNADSAALIAQSTANAAKSAADSNYNYANSEIAVQSTATAKAQSTADNAFSQAQAVGSQADSEIAVQSTATAKAQSTADNAFSQAQAVGSQASAEINSNSTATAKAQSTADNAFSQATTAIDNGKVTSQAVTDLKDGSTLTIDQLGNGLATKVSSSDYASYKEQTASQIASKVDNGAFSAYQTQTADLIASKVATDDFSTYKDQTAKSIDSKVESKDFNTYKTQTADLIDSKVSNSAYASDKTQTASEIADRVSNSAFSAYQTQTASQIASKVDNGDFSTYKTQTADLIASKVATKDFSAYQATTAKEISSKVESSDFNTYKAQTADAIQNIVTKSPSNIIKDGGFNSAVVGQTPSGWDWSTLGQIVANPDAASNLVATGHPVLQLNSQISSNSDVYYGDWFDVQPGDQFYTEFKARWSNMSQKGRIVLGVVTKNAAGHWTWTSGAITSSPGNWAKYTGVLTIPAGAVQGRVWVAWQWSAAANEDVQVTDLVVRPAYATQSQITQLSGEITQKVSNGDFNSYKTQTDKLIGQKVDNGDFKTYKTQTADAISSKVATKDFKAYQATTAKSIESKVESSDFNTYKQQTADAITSKVANSDFSTYKTQTAKDINLRVTKGDLIDQINLQAGNTLISSSGQLTLAADTIYFDTKKPVIIPSANITGTLTGKTINASTINGTTFHGGDMISNSNNTAGYYPMSIDSSGTYNSTTINNVIALRASVQSGAIIYDYRSMLPNDNGKYIYSNTVINGQGVTIESGHTDTKDSTFNAKRTGRSYISLTPSGGLMLSGPNSNIDFAGMYMNPYGNIIGKSAAAYWQISKHGKDNSGGGVTARFGIDTGDKGTINFYRPLFVDEIGGFTSSNGHALFIHGDDNGTSGSTGQMIFRKDGRSAQVVSASIYNRTYSSGSTVTVTSYGTLGRITSASKYKLDITKETSISPANKLLSIDMSSWIDKSSAELLADSKTNGTELSEPEINVNRHYGLIAEDLIKAGLGEFVIRGDKGQAEGIEYDRLWITLIPKIRQLSNENIQNKMTISRLENEIENIKQGR
ncbi:hypothetical protein [Lactiplantibacillus pentosus]|uniref:hypothetical protein n=1 Tax=Lactiplantibacillus pentosus TaxID=1589 RepID=UPI0019316CC3|nr:hypothetical protein [Lactiplantibacillus pentosus]